MRTEQIQNFALIGLLFLLAVGMGIAYWFGTTDSSVGASTPAAPVKKFRADPGTERENARALISSVPSVEEETTDRPIDIWGSLDEDEEPIQESFNAAQASIEGMSPEEARDSLSERLESDELGNEERAQLEAALGLALLEGDEPDIDASREAFGRAFNACADGDARVLLAFAYAEALYEREEYVETLELLRDGRFVGATFSPFRLKLEALRGLALDALGRPDQARAAYKRAFESALSSELQTSPRARDATRLVALQLARHYREDGRTEDATAISRMLRAWLKEDELILR